MASDFVQPKRELKKKMKINKIINFLKEDLKDFSVQELQDYRLNPELIKYVCNLVETKMTKKYKPNKKEIVLNILSKLIPAVNDVDRKSISDSIEFLHGNGDIKTLTLFRYLGRTLFSVLKKKLTN